MSEKYRIERFKAEHVEWVVESLKRGMRCCEIGLTFRLEFTDFAPGVPDKVVKNRIERRASVYLNHDQYASEIREALSRRQLAELGELSDGPQDVTLDQLEVDARRSYVRGRSQQKRREAAGQMSIDEMLKWARLDELRAKHWLRIKKASEAEKDDESWCPTDRNFNIHGEDDDDELNDYSQSGRTHPESAPELDSVPTVVEPTQPQAEAESTQNIEASEVADRPSVPLHALDVNQQEDFLSSVGLKREQVYAIAKCFESKFTPEQIAEETELSLETVERCLRDDLKIECSPAEHVAPKEKWLSAIPGRKYLERPSTPGRHLYAGEKEVVRA